MPYRFDTDYLERAPLRDGSEVVLRLVRPEDKELLVRGLARLSSESRYRRFFTSKSRLGEAELRYLTEIDQHDHFALGAVRRRGDDAGGSREEGIGVARFVRLPDRPGAAEPAIAVVDDEQGKGLGRLLLLRLIAAASERGVERFVSEVLAENIAMLALLHELAPNAHEQVEHDVVLVELELPEVLCTEPAVSEPDRGGIYRLMRLVAKGLVRLRRRIAEA